MRVVSTAQVMEFESTIRCDPLCPSIKFVVMYSSNLRAERKVLQGVLSHILSRPAITFRNFNAITNLNESKGLSAKLLLWPWIHDIEVSCKLVELVKLACGGSPPLLGFCRIVLQ